MLPSQKICCQQGGEQSRISISSLQHETNPFNQHTEIRIKMSEKTVQLWGGHCPNGAKPERLYKAPCFRRGT